jgi:IrrE N-terminal-like domain
MHSFSNLRLFCEHVVRKHGEPADVPEEQLAEDFRTVYLKGLPLNLKTLRAAAASCGIRLKELERMPENIRGYHEVYGDDKNIYFRKGDALSGIENTILHEIREMMETLFTEVQPDYTPLRTSARHIAANRFAAAVLLPRVDFEKKIYDSGFDVVELSRLYSKSCSQVLLRMGEVLQGKLFMYAALYEPDAENEWHVTYWTGCSNDTDPDANVYGGDSLFPRRGREVVPGSLVDLTLQGKKPYLAQHITLLEDSYEDGLVAIARPLIISGAPVKVSLAVLLEQNRNLFLPQIKRSKPAIVEGFHRHL